MPIRRKKPKPSEELTPEAYQYISTVVRQATVAQQAGTTNPRGLTKEQRDAIKAVMVRAKQQTYTYTAAGPYTPTSGGGASIPSPLIPPPTSSLPSELEEAITKYVRKQVRAHIEQELATQLAAFQEQIDEIWEELREK